MANEYVQIPTSDGDMPAYAADPGEARGAVLVIQEVFGITPHIEEVCRRLAAEGWYALAPAFFHRDGSPVVAYDNPDPGVELMRSLTEAGIAIDLVAAMDYLATEGYENQAVGTVGFCMGGSLALYAGASFDLGAAVTFYGVGITAGQAGLPPLVELAPKLRCPWLGLYGAEDTRASAEQVEALRAAAAQADAPTEIVVYEGAGHAFNCDARPDRFSPAAAADAWGRMLALFDAHVR